MAIAGVILHRLDPVECLASIAVQLIHLLRTGTILLIGAASSASSQMRKLSGTCGIARLRNRESMHAMAVFRFSALSEIRSSVARASCLARTR